MASSAHSANNNLLNASLKKDPKGRGFIYSLEKMYVKTPLWMNPRGSSFLAKR